MIVYSHSTGWVVAFRCVLSSQWYGQVITYPVLFCITDRWNWQLSLQCHQEVTVSAYCHFTGGHLFSQPVLQENGGQLHGEPPPADLQQVPGLDVTLSQPVLQENGGQLHGEPPPADLHQVPGLDVTLWCCRKGRSRQRVEPTSVFQAVPEVASQEGLLG